MVVEYAMVSGPSFCTGILGMAQSIAEEAKKTRITLLQGLTSCPFRLTRDALAVSSTR
jgi:hypothetical protein